MSRQPTHGSDRYPLPVRATGLRILTSDNLPEMAVLECDTEANPVRVWLDKEQLQQLARQAGLAAEKMLPE